MQWMPSTNHVSYQGLYPDDLTKSFMHHPMSHRIANRNDVLSTPPTGTNLSVVEFLTNAHTRFNQKMGEAALLFKNAVDVYGAPLLDHTIIPFQTDTADTTHARSPLPAVVLGGKALGLVGGQYVSANRHNNELWLSIAQAFMPDEDVVSALSQETFAQNTLQFAPIDGLWVRP
jgi:hypothetical protein